MLLELIKILFNKLGVIVLGAFILSKSELVKYFLLKKKLTIYDKLFFSLVFGCVGILGTYFAIPVEGALANSRSIGVIIAGLFGGPAVGIGAGLIAGIHGMVIPVGKFTAIACGISTILGGALAGFAKKFIEDKPKKWIWGILIAAFIESIQMIIILIVAKPFSEALHLVKIIFVPMTFINSFGTGIFLVLIEQIHDEYEKAGAAKAQLALRIASKTLVYLRQGLNEYSAQKAAELIYKEIKVSAVSFTDRESILAYVGVGSDHHKKGFPIYTQITKRAIQEKRYIVAQEKKDIECSYKNCKLKGVIVVPLKSNQNVIGTLKLYKISENSITSSDKELARGLGQLFSTQLELSEIDYQKELLSKAELKALQAQIQPHFLFNTLNTIVSFCRTDPEKARELLLKLSYYLRNNFKTTGDFITLKEEILYIESYLTIEQARFSDRLKVEYNIEKDIQCKIPPLIIQPIVENAVKHGLMTRKSGGKIVISAKQAEEYVIITISDNGIGMSDKQVKSLFNNNIKQGIGVNNVNNRLKSIYNTGLEIKSEEGEGTTVIMKIPIRGEKHD